MCAAGSRFEGVPGTRMFQITFKASKMEPSNSKRPNRNISPHSVQNKRPRLGPRPRAEPYVRSTALGGFASTQAGPRKTPPIGVMLEDVGTSVAA